MNRGLIIIISSLILLITSACGGNQQGGGRQGAQTNVEPLYREQNNDTRIGMVRNDQINGDESARGGGQNEIGYFRYNPDHYINQKGRAAGPDVFVDRTVLARHIAQLVTVLPNVKEATALVTDDHVFIGVATKNNKLDAKTVKEARRTAESVTPRYYRIHVTTDKNLNSQIQRVGMRMAGNRDVQGIRGDLEQLLRKMGDETPPDLNENIQPNSRRNINPQMD